MANRKRKIDFEEFKKYINSVEKQLEDYFNKNNLKVDYVCPIMRGGLVPATFIANRLNIIKFAPFQVKHMQDKNQSKIEMIFNPLNEIKTSKEDLVFLVVEGVHSTGTSAKLCLDKIRERYKNAKIIYACIIKEYGSTSFEDIVQFECHAKIIGKELSVEECEKLGIESNFLLFPWENEEVEDNNLDEDINNIIF